MSRVLSSQNLQDGVGQESGVSDWVEVSQEDVNLFADVTRDHQFIHVDPEKAAQTPFGGPIAHGFLSLSMLSHFAETGFALDVSNAVMGVNYGFDKVRFINPVRVGSKIRGRATLLEATEKSPGQFLFKHNVVVEIDGVDKPALIAEWLTMIVTG